MTDATDARRRLPAMGRLLDDPEISRLFALYGRDRVRVQAERGLKVLRDRLASPSGLSDRELEEAVERLPGDVERALGDLLGGSLRRVLNATGILLHTNLGRAPLPHDVAAELPRLLDAYCDLEFDLHNGKRGDRNRRAATLLSVLTGAPAALVVNNNAAAMVLVLATFARDREVVVSRGELVEIGGSFRIPTILEAAGARLVEVGTTNRTRLADYEAAIGEQTAVVLKVFPSNYRLTGFVASVEVPSLVDLCRRRDVPLLVDEGSGLLRPHHAPQLAEHLSLQELMSLGCHLACGSGDKILGGPQAGLLVGEEELIQRCKTHPLYRALRPDRTCFAALEGVLRRHLGEQEMALDRLWEDPASLRLRLERLAAAIGGEIVASDAFVGGGSAPESPIPGEAVALPADDRLMRRLRDGEPPVIVYQKAGRLLIDLRTIAPRDDDTLAALVKSALIAD